MNVEYLTECYIKAYEKALELSNDENTATGAAMAIVNIIANQTRIHTQNTSAYLLKAIASFNGNTKSATKKKSKDEERGIK